MPPVPRSPSQDEQETERLRVKAIFDGLLAQCEELHERLVEALLGQIEQKEG